MVGSLFSYICWQKAHLRFMEKAEKKLSEMKEVVEVKKPKVKPVFRPAGTRILLPNAPVGESILSKL